MERYALIGMDGGKCLRAVARIRGNPCKPCAGMRDGEILDASMFCGRRELLDSGLSIFSR